MAKGIKTGGRVAGTPNKTPTAIKDMIIKALDDCGGVEYLKKQAVDNPNAFLTLVGKVIPLQVTGDGGGPIETSSTINIRNAPDDVVKFLAGQRIDDDNS